MKNEKRKMNPVLTVSCIALVIAMITCAVLYAMYGGSMPTLSRTDSTEPTDDGGFIEPAQKEPSDNPLIFDPDHTPTVIIDAGHGFGDVGCAGPETELGEWEKDATLDMVHTLKKHFESLGVKVLLTHDGSTFPSCEQLAKLCSEAGVEYDPEKESWCEDNIFSPYERAIYMNYLDKIYGVNFAISIHVNSIENKDRSGFDLDYCAQNSASDQSKKLAEALKSALKSAYPSRDMHFFADSWDDAFIVTKFTLMPSALLETGYYTNANDVALLRDKTWRDNLMKTVAQTITSQISN